MRQEQGREERDPTVTPHSEFYLTHFYASSNTECRLFVGGEGAPTSLVFASVDNVYFAQFQVGEERDTDLGKEEMGER